MLEQSIEDLRAALAPYMTAVVNGAKKIKLDDLLVVSRGQSASKEPKSGDAMAAGFRIWAAMWNGNFRDEASEA